MGSWVKLDTPAQKFRVLLPPPPPPYHYPQVAVGLPAVKICMHSIIISFLCEQTFSTALHSRLLLRSLMRQCGPLVSIYIMHIKYIKIISLFWEHFLGWSKKSVDPSMCSNKLTAGFFRLAIFTIRKQKCEQNTVSGNWCISHPTQSSNECT